MADGCSCEGKELKLKSAENIFLHHTKVEILRDHRSVKWLAILRFNFQPEELEFQLRRVS